MRHLRKHSSFFWLAVIALGWAILFAAPKVSQGHSLLTSFPYYHTGK